MYFSRRRPYLIIHNIYILLRIVSSYSSPLFFHTRHRAAARPERENAQAVKNFTFAYKYNDAAFPKLGENGRWDQGTPTRTNALRCAFISCIHSHAPPPPLSPASSRCRSRFSLSLPPHNLFLFPLKMNIYRHGTTVVRDHGEHPPHPTSHPSSSSSSGTPPPPKLGLFSGHDTTLMPILATLGDKVWPGTEWVP